MLYYFAYNNILEALHTLYHIRGALSIFEFKLQTAYRDTLENAVFSKLKIQIVHYITS